MGRRSLDAANAIHYHQWTLPGENAATLTISNVRPADAGEYRVLVSNDRGTRPSHSAILTLDPKLQIFSAANTTTLIWPPEAHLRLEAAPLATGPWTVVPNPPNAFFVSPSDPAKFFRLRRVE